MPDKICNKHKINFEDNPELFSISVDYRYYKKSKGKKFIRTRCSLCKKINQKKWCSKKEVIENRRVYFRAYEKERKKVDVNYKIIKLLRSRIWRALKKNVKSNSTMKLTGCTVEQLKKYIESKFEDGMSWDNYGTWHVDHIIPCAQFDLSNPEQQKICFHYTNLQPMWGEDNICLLYTSPSPRD